MVNARLGGDSNNEPLETIVSLTENEFSVPEAKLEDMLAIFDREEEPVDEQTDDDRKLWGISLPSVNIPKPNINIHVPDKLKPKKATRCCTFDGGLTCTQYKAYDFEAELYCVRDAKNWAKHYPASGSMSRGECGCGCEKPNGGHWNGGC
eukprot:CAMPEP_0178484902 /NCGR_PEP_ID=MMETSP0696-20121128/7994_1 /TAXON_ID=265572 /ORGANISM="Extubocellulus spinifer, Strain CCMP396" /LENGTH=149 /DNA_ID=CAMNT_0020112475 /DNA_START=266 /DNA_END=715 /DNA_ORIENTATION=+